MIGDDFLSDNSYQCPFCNNYFPLNGYTSNYNTFSFKNEGKIDYYLENNPVKISNSDEFKDAILIRKMLCPACDKNIIKLKGLGKDVKSIELSVYPDSSAKQFPEYIPSSIKQDYEEACKIVNLSPKASATLSRRCLQGMIRDYWNISGKNNLFQEIDAISDKVTPQVRQVLDSVRQLGNIGAHMEKDINLIVDIDAGEAQQLINLIEYLMEQWYIHRYESELMLASIIDINQTKQEERKNQ